MSTTNTREIELRVTENGFEPARVSLVRDETVTLVVTRKTERTCARTLVLDAYDILQPLPFEKPVRITFTPRESGPLRYGCAMGKMISGILAVV
jgi:plastocyanin domain-containing protein